MKWRFVLAVSVILAAAIIAFAFRWAPAGIPRLAVVDRWTGCIHLVVVNPTTGARPRLRDVLQPRDPYATAFAPEEAGWTWRVYCPSP